MEDEVGERLDTNDLLAAMCRAVIDGGRGGEPTMARSQISLTICEQCDRGWQDAAGASFEVTPAVIERARCDAQHLGRVDATEPARATQDVSPAVRRQVWRRDQGRCCVPGCRSTRHLDIHHLEHRARGGDHTARNLCLLCSGHHAAHHDGKLIIEGTIATGLVFRHADGRTYGTSPPSSISHVGENAGVSPPSSTIAHDVMRALTSLGFRPAEARSATDAAISHVGEEARVEAVLQQALRSLAPMRGTPTS